MEALKLDTIIKKDGEIVLTGIPCKKGEKIEMIILLDSNNKKYVNVLDILPKHQLHSDNQNLSRENIYKDAR